MAYGQSDRPGFILATVLIIVAIATAMGLACVVGSTVRLVASQNQLNATRAQYLAESGLQHALSVLEDNPKALNGSARRPLGPFHVDNTPDSYRFWVTSDEKIPGRYYLFSQGNAGAVSRTRSYSVFRAAGAQFKLSHGLTVGGFGASLPQSLEIDGDIQNNGGFLLTFARIHGNVTSHGAVIDPFHRIKGDIVTDADQAEMPTISIAPYLSYTLNGRSSTATEVIGNTFDADQPLNGGAAESRTNVGGVVLLKPEVGHDVTLTNNVKFQGTILIDGDLVLAGRRISLTAVEGFPAVVTTGRLLIGRNSKATINGLVMASGGIVPQDGRANRSRLVIRGGLVATWLGYDPNLRGRHKLTYVADRCEIYDFSGSSSQGATLKILDYN